MALEPIHSPGHPDFDNLSPSEHISHAKSLEKAGYGGSTEHENHVNRAYGWDKAPSKPMQKMIVERAKSGKGITKSHARQEFENYAKKAIENRNTGKTQKVMKAAARTMGTSNGYMVGGSPAKDDNMAATA